MSIRSLSLAVLLVGPHRCALLSSFFKAPDQILLFWTTRRRQPVKTDSYGGPRWRCNNEQVSA